MASSIRLLVVCWLPAAVFGWWPFSGQVEHEQLEQLTHTVESQVRKAAVFEMMTAEQKFLSEAQQFLDLSPLDQCLHGVSVCMNRSLH